MHRFLKGHETLRIIIDAALMDAVAVAITVALLIGIKAVML